MKGTWGIGLALGALLAGSAILLTWLLGKQEGVPEGGAPWSRTAQTASQSGRPTGPIGKVGVPPSATASAPSSPPSSEAVVPPSRRPYAPAFITRTAQVGRVTAQRPLSQTPPVYGNVVRVDRFGARGDGRSDDTRALTRAVAVLRAGQTLYFPPGTYRITRPLRLPSGVDVLGMRATLVAENGPAIELVGNISDVSIRNLSVRGQRPAAIYQCGGAVRHLYLERCEVAGPSDPRPLPAGAEGYQGWAADGILFTHVVDSTLCFSRLSGGRAALAVEGYLNNLAVIGCTMDDPMNSTAFYFDAPNSGPALLLNNAVRGNRGHVIAARAVCHLTVRGLSAEGIGASLPEGSRPGPMMDIRQGEGVDIEQVRLAPLLWGKAKWPGGLVRLDGTGHTLAGAFLVGSDKCIRPSLASTDPNLVLWGVRFPGAALELQGTAERRMVFGSTFDSGALPDSIGTPEGWQAAAQATPDGEEIEISPEARREPVVWGPPLPRFRWRDLGLPNVRAYGARGDGRTDDWHAFSRALARTRLLYVPSGVYRVSRPIGIALRPGGSYQVPGFVMVGDGIGRTVIVADARVPAVIGVPSAGRAGTWSAAHSFWADLTIRGGQAGVRLPSTTDLFLVRVGFEGQTVAGMIAHSIRDSLLLQCTFRGGAYGLAAGAWGRRQASQLTLWRCLFEGQAKEGVVVAAADGRSPGAWGHVALRDCVIRFSGGPGAFLSSAPAQPVVVDHCRIENCAQYDGSPYLLFSRGHGSSVGLYHTLVRRTQGRVPQAMVSIVGYDQARLQALTIEGASGTIALNVGAPILWLEGVRADGRLETAPPYSLATTQRVSRLIERSQFASRESSTASWGQAIP